MRQILYRVIKTDYPFKLGYPVSWLIEAIWLVGLAIYVCSGGFVELPWAQRLKGVALEFTKGVETE